MIVHITDSIAMVVLKSAIREKRQSTGRNVDESAIRAHFVNTGLSTGIYTGQKEENYANFTRTVISSRRTIMTSLDLNIVLGINNESYKCKKKSFVS